MLVLLPQETLEDILIPRIELNGGRKPHIVRYTLEQNLKPIVDCRESLFEKAYPVKEHVAKKMLQIGYKHPSRFGRWCPVKVGDCILLISQMMKNMSQILCSLQGSFVAMTTCLCANGKVEHGPVFHLSVTL